SLDGDRGESARELFQSARTLDPDNEIARRGLRQVGEKLLARARDALARNELEPARRAAAAARELLGGGVAVDEVDKAAAAMVARGTQTESLLAAAQAELEGGRVLGANGAAALHEKTPAAE